MNPLFAIIIPVYKCESYISATIKSVLAQTYGNFECICVDDGSPDGAGQLLDELAQTDDRLRVIHQKNGGVSSARNAGIEEAHGEWLLFLDADDLYRRELLSDVARVIGQYPVVDMVLFGYESFNDGDSWGQNQTPSYSSAFHVLGSEVSYALAKGTAMWQWAYKRDALGDLRFNVYYRGMEDHPFKCEALLRRASSYAVLSGIYLGYRQRSSSFMHTKPSAETWGNELKYRVDVFLMSEYGPRKITGLTGDTDWAEFVFKGFLLGVERYDGDDLSMLSVVWIRELQRLKSIRSFPLRRKVVIRICLLARSLALSRLLCLGCKWWVCRCSLFNGPRRWYRKICRSGEYASEVVDRS